MERGHRDPQQVRGRPLSPPGQLAPQLAAPLFFAGTAPKPYILQWSAAIETLNRYEGQPLMPPSCCTRPARSPAGLAAPLFFSLLVQSLSPKSYIMRTKTGVRSRLYHGCRLPHLVNP